ncbi:MAG: amidohydrolase [Alphaproteobacteria bacterium]|jgi:2,3-dihydroxybenzoate decarboxylase|nr:amidohydrolase [Alphaproteobacteria bacterium]MBT4083929.1 amidohydrolase [Alphaproteobacteria bacterium]MBT4543416.1 amidohydrolase [Alphaproteobacteria bacterium]MBT7747717.1 amidohydrolase [Alphaproteobacteria bacterium]
MKGKIAFEEHIAIAETLDSTKAFAGDSGKFEEFKRQIMDVGSERLEHMDKTGIEYAIQSLNAPGIQAILDTSEAIETAKKGNEKLADAAARHPDRFGAFAALPMQDPDAAAAELTRCVKELGFKGAMVNGFTQKGVPDSAIYYDLPEYRDFWATVSELDVPFYLHPRMQIPSRAQNYDGHPWLMSAPWGFAVETATHSLRLCGSGLFDDFPNLRIVIGHLGEFIPHALWRIDARMRFSRRDYRGKRPLGEYFQEHFYITTSGFFHDPAFRNTLDVMGKDRMFFSADYPFENMEDAADWYDGTEIVSGQDQINIGRNNAIKLFDLDLKPG